MSREKFEAEFWGERRDVPLPPSRVSNRSAVRAGEIHAIYVAAEFMISSNKFWGESFTDEIVSYVYHSYCFYGSYGIPGRYVIVS